MDNRKFAVIIPARYASSRFPGKPLALIGGKTMIQRVFEQASKAIDTVFVATDDERIYNAVADFGGNAVMTSPNHASGTDRCAEAVNKIMEQTGKNIDVVINVQGDEPFIKPQQIELLKACFVDETVSIATLIRKVKSDEDLDNPNQVKVVRNLSGNAIYFSRSVIPYVRDVDRNIWALKHTFYKHLGIYAYTVPTLHKITSLSKSSLETAESLEQNRWIENGFSIRTAITTYENRGIDTPNDLKNAEIFLQSKL